MLSAWFADTVKRDDLASRNVEGGEQPRALGGRLSRGNGQLASGNLHEGLQDEPPPPGRLSLVRNGLSMVRRFAKGVKRTHAKPLIQLGLSVFFR
jgi:hypothetical protein